MTIEITPSGQACGATVRGVDLRALDPETVADIRAAWLDHKVLAFPDQPLSDDDLERFTLNFGPFANDPFFAAIDGHPHIAAISRKADETSSLFAEKLNWSETRSPDPVSAASRSSPSRGRIILISLERPRKRSPISTVQSLLERSRFRGPA